MVPRTPGLRDGRDLRRGRTSTKSWRTTSRDRGPTRLSRRSRKVDPKQAHSTLGTDLRPSSPASGTPVLGAGGRTYPEETPRSDGSRCQTGGDRERTVGARAASKLRVPHPWSRGPGEPVLTTPKTRHHLHPVRDEGGASGGCTGPEHRRRATGPEGVLRLTDHGTTLLSRPGRGGPGVATATMVDREGGSEGLRRFMRTETTHNLGAVQIDRLPSTLL